MCCMSVFMGYFMLPHAKCLVWAQVSPDPQTSFSWWCSITSIAMLSLKMGERDVRLQSSGCQKGKKYKNKRKQTFCTHFVKKRSETAKTGRILSAIWGKSRPDWERVVPIRRHQVALPPRERHRPPHRGIPSLPTGPWSPQTTPQSRLTPLSPSGIRPIPPPVFQRHLDAITAQLFSPKKGHR